MLSAPGRDALADAGAAAAIYRPSMGPRGGPQRQVLVVGAGPAGLVAAISLALYGIDVVVIDKRTSTSTLSRALVISTRCMEIFRAWGLEDEIQSGAADVESRGWVTPRSLRQRGPRCRSATRRLRACRILSYTNHDG
ncbi:MAG TPA: FAD-dependent monooxygenase [Acidimicrobiales bacterium]|nr:FAD-dependent monooxygenase [Acidimicrobiales bacterium]